jgi:hypothetical protein
VTDGIAAGRGGLIVSAGAEKHQRQQGHTRPAPSGDSSVELPIRPRAHKGSRRMHYQLWPHVLHSPAMPITLLERYGRSKVAQIIAEPYASACLAHPGSILR